MIDSYNTVIFDCDGVVLNSNKIKTNAFYEVAIKFGVEAAELFVEYHKNFGGVSRYKKFDYFLKTVVKQPEYKLQDLLNQYQVVVKNGLYECDVSPKLNSIRDELSHQNWLIVSGGDQDEIREVFKERKLNHMFLGGIFGSPDIKEKILDREIRNGNIKFPAIFLGDSKYDYEVAQKMNIDFIFINAWTELQDADEWTSRNSIVSVEKISDLI